jgi:hypothetical protein
MMIEMPDLIERIELNHWKYLKYYKTDEENRNKLLGDLFRSRDVYAREELGVGPDKLGKYYCIKTEEKDKRTGWRIFYAEAHYWRK